MTTAPDRSPRLYNEDLAPAESRNWGTYSLFAMWMSDIHSIGGYTFAAGLFALGLNAYGVFGGLTLGIVLVFLLMNLSGYAGQALGVPYPVISRLSFGTIGANLPALVRAIVAIFWYSIQTWLASKAALVLAVKMFPGLESLTKNDILGESTLGWLAFLAMWAVQLLLLRNGMETIRRFQDWAGPAVWVVMFALTFYILARSGWHISLSLPGADAEHGVFHAFLAAVSLTVAYFSTLLLNFCDFSRFAPSRKAVWTANIWGLPANFMAFSVVSVLVTAGTYNVFGEHISDPVEVVSRIDNVLALALGAVTFAVATIGINVVANFVSPAYDLANVAPHKIDFRKGGLISALIALFLFPWHLFNSPAVVNQFIGSLAALLGPLFGVIMVDYYILRRRRVVIDDLYREQGHYTYQNGWNPKALISAAAGAVPSIIFAVVPAFATSVGPFSWFIGAAIAAVVHYTISKRDPHIVRAIEDARAQTDIHQPITR